MTDNNDYEYDPEIEYIEEEDEGYSVPKILVAILILIIVGAGGFILSQQKKIRSVVTVLKTEKDQVDYELNEMIEKYNLAIDDNDNLADELTEERDQLIKFRDSMRNVSNENIKKNNKDVAANILKFKKESSIAFNKRKKKNSSSNKKKSSNNTSNKNDISNNNSTPSENNTKNLIADISNAKNKLPNTASDTDNSSTKNKTELQSQKINSKSLESGSKEKEGKKTEGKISEKKVDLNAPQSFSHVEVPPTYPGCSGSAAQRKACFTNNVRKLISKKFDPSVASDLNLSSGKKRVFVSFMIDKFGYIKNVKAKGPHQLLEYEAIKAAKSLPKMMAARQNGIPVSVTYNIPITFILE